MNYETKIMKWISERSFFMLYLTIAGFLIITVLEEKSAAINREAFIELYNQRLSAERYTLAISQQLQEMNEIINSPDYLSFHRQQLLDKHISSINSLNAEYSKTYPTQKQAGGFRTLQKACGTFIRYNTPGERLNFRLSIQRANAALSVMSEMHIAEGNKKLAAEGTSYTFMIKLLVVLVAELVLFTLVCTSYPGADTGKTGLTNRNWFIHISKN